MNFKQFWRNSLFVKKENILIKYMYIRFFRWPSSHFNNFPVYLYKNTYIGKDTYFIPIVHFNLFITICFIFYLFHYFSESIFIGYIQICTH